VGMSCRSKTRISRRRDVPFQHSVVMDAQEKVERMERNRDDNQRRKKKPSEQVSIVETILRAEPWFVVSQAL